MMNHSASSRAYRSTCPPRSSATLQESTASASPPPTGAATCRLLLRQPTCARAEDTCLHPRTTSPCRTRSPRSFPDHRPRARSNARVSPLGEPMECLISPTPNPPNRHRHRPSRVSARRTFRPSLGDSDPARRARAARVPSSCASSAVSCPYSHTAKARARPRQMQDADAVAEADAWTTHPRTSVSTSERRTALHRCPNPPCPPPPPRLPLASHARHPSLAHHSPS